MAAKAEEDAVKKQVAELRNDIRTTALEIIARRMPKKVVFLDKVLKEDPRVNVPLAEIDRIFREDWNSRSTTSNPARASTQEEPKNKKRKQMDEEKDEKEPTKTTTTTTTQPVVAAAAATTSDITQIAVQSNKAIKNVIDFLRVELVDLIDMLNTVKMWIQLNIPRIEDGNNFGVNIQEETVSELGRAEEAAFTGFENMTKYYITRGKLITKALKYPLLTDYTTAVSELDQKEYTNMRLTLLDVRNNYAIIYDMVVKNLERIKNPRGTDHTDRIF